MRYKTLYPLLAFMLLLNTTQAQFSIQKAVLEVYTGSWSQYSPDGFVKLDSVLATYPDAFAIQVHSGDSMTISEEADLVNFYAPSYPQAVINRSGTLYSRSQWGTHTASVLSSASSVTVTFDSVTYNNNSRQLDVYLRALFTGTVSGDLRFNCVVVEDSVSGMGAGYDQANAYNNTPGHYYYGAGNPITGLPHRYVARAYLGGTWGTAGVIPASNAFGSQAVYHYTYILPAYCTDYRVSLVGMVSRYDGNNPSDRETINAERWPQIATAPVTGIASIYNNVYYTIYPNPASAVVYVQQASSNRPATFELTDITGRVLLAEYLNGSTTSIPVTGISKGMYLYNIRSHSQCVSSGKLLLE
ncbi:MAG TPA: T9SS type A sorting domain-containing protein [Chitinophagales bacterium]|nr:T9SS type A sorting domain-containing protein [Chitinophagales bacterium]